MKEINFLIAILLLIGIFSCKDKDEEPLRDPYLEFVSPADANVLVNSNGSYSNPLMVTLKTNREVLITGIDSSRNNTANWMNVNSSELHNGTVNLRIMVEPTFIKRAATITMVTKPKNDEAIKQATLTISLRQSTINLSPGTLSDYGKLLYMIEEMDIDGKIDARDIQFMYQEMPNLKKINLRNADIVTYSGTQGTASELYVFYPASEMPEFSFCYVLNIGGKKGLSSVILPTNLSRIGKGAFSDCGLEKIDIPDKVISIGANAFSGCSKLSSVNLPANLKSIEEGAFGDCKELASINLPDNLTLIQDGTFIFCSKLSSVDFPSSLISIGSSAFRYTNLQTLNFPTGLISIGSLAFNACNSLNAISFPRGLKSIGNNAFSVCTKLTELNLPEGLTSLGSSSFESCNELKTVTLPSSLTSIGSFAFNGCFNLEEIRCYSENPSNINMSGAIFSDEIKSTCILKVPAVAIEFYKTAYVWKDFKNIQAL